MKKIIVTSDKLFPIFKKAINDWNNYNAAPITKKTRRCVKEKQKEKDLLKGTLNEARKLLNNTILKARQ